MLQDDFVTKRCFGQQQFDSLSLDPQNCSLLLRTAPVVELSVFLRPVTLLTLEFSRPAALRMVSDVARIQCDVK